MWSWRSRPTVCTGTGWTGAASIPWSSRNLSQDHLDYHGNLEDYFLAKTILFHRLLAASDKDEVGAVINMEDPYGQRLATSLKEIPVIGFGLSDEFAVHPVDAELTPEGHSCDGQDSAGRAADQSPFSRSVQFNEHSTAVAVAYVIRIPGEAIINGIANLANVPGRLERIPAATETVFVDYAHTPDALKTVLAAVQDIASGRIITVMGCGGDRDKTKRPLMGKEAAMGSDFVVVTSDNPRSEDPMAIIEQVVEGCIEAGCQPLPDHLARMPLPPGYFRAIPDRREAIAWAVRNLQSKGVLLVAGKGHETYQEVNGVRYPFDDSEILREELKKAAAERSVSDRSALGSGDAL